MPASFNRRVGNIGLTSIEHPVSVSFGLPYQPSAFVIA
jgi:hypothetical protein